MGRADHLAGDLRGREEAAGRWGKGQCMGLGKELGPWKINNDHVMWYWKLLRDQILQSPRRWGWFRAPIWHAAHSGAVLGCPDNIAKAKVFFFFLDRLLVWLRRFVRLTVGRTVRTGAGARLRRLGIKIRSGRESGKREARSINISYTNRYA